ncbi:MAG: GAF domain-containing protein [Aquabacterium sp.]
MAAQPLFHTMASIPNLDGRLTKGQMRALELAVGGASLPLVLAALVGAIEASADRGVKASVLLLDKGGRRLLHGAAPSLPTSYNEAVDGLEIGPGVGACGTAAYLQSTVLAFDIATDDRWAAFRDLALSHGLRACWSTPIRSSKGALLGTFALYYPQPTEPSPSEMEAVSLLTNTAAIVIERHIETEERERAELALHELGMQLGMITDAIPALISYITPDYRYKLVNRHYEEWFGSREAVLGHRMPDLLGEAAWAKVEPWMKQALAGKPVEYESRLAFKDGRIRWVNARYTPDMDATGAVRGVVALVTNIDQRKRSAERQDFLNELMQATQPLSDPAEVTRRTAQLLADFLGADRCAYARIERDPQEVFVITGDYTRRVPSIVGRWPVRAFGQECERLMRCNLPYVVHDTDRDPRISSADALAYRATTSRSVICVPLHKDGQFTAAMAVHQATPRVWSSGEIDLVQSVVANCWESLERCRAAQELSDSEMRYRTLFESMDEGFILGEVAFDESGRPVDILYLDSNPAAIRITGVDYRGRRLSELTPAYESHWLEIWGRVACTGVGERDQRYAAPLDKWFDFYVYPVGNKVAIVFQDITAQRAIAEAASQSATRHAFMVSVGDSLRDVVETHEIEGIAARLLGEQLGADSAFYVQYDEVNQLAVVHEEFKPRDDTTSLVGNYLMRDFAVSHDILRRGQPLILSDIPSEPGLSEAERAQYRLLGMRALLCVSLVKQGCLVGGLVVARSGRA